MNGRWTGLRSGASRAGLITVSLTAALALVGCSGGSSAGTDPAASSTAPVTAATTQTSGATSAPATSTPPVSPSTALPAAVNQVITVAVAGGKVTGPKGRVKVKKGSTVQLVVTSDIADEVHLHGYDKHVDVEKGGTAALTFKATISGVFEVELEGKKLKLTELQVQ